MTVVFQLPGSTSSRRDAFAVACSPLAEASFSLRVLVNPARFRAHAGWIRSCRHLPTGLRCELAALTPIFAHAVPGFLTATTSASSSYADELARASTLRAGDARAEVLAVPDTWTSLHDRRAAAHTTMRRRAEELRAQWEQDPREALNQLLALLERYWQAAFRAEWDRITPPLRAEIRTCADRVQLGREPALGPAVQLENDAVVVETACRYIEQAVPDGKQLTLSPSAFLWPRVSTESSPRWPFAVFYPLPRSPQLRPSAAADELLPTLRALADGTRLTIVRQIVERPRSTQELSELLAISEAAVSQHLRQLRAAGLVTTKREGHYVLYSIEPRSLRRVATALADLTSDGYTSPKKSRRPTRASTRIKRHKRCAYPPRSSTRRSLQLHTPDARRVSTKTRQRPSSTRRGPVSLALALAHRKHCESAFSARRT